MRLKAATAEDILKIDYISQDADDSEGESWCYP